MKKPFTCGKCEAHFLKAAHLAQHMHDKHKIEVS